MTERLSAMSGLGLLLSFSFTLAKFFLSLLCTTLLTIDSKASRFQASRFMITMHQPHWTHYHCKLHDIRRNNWSSYWPDEWWQSLQQTVRSYISFTLLSVMQTSQSNIVLLGTVATGSRSLSEFADGGLHLCMHDYTFVCKFILKVVCFWTRD